MTPYLLILAVLLGIAPGLIAHGKGRNFLLWWIYGVVLGPVALLHAILLRRRPEPFYAATYAAPVRHARTRWRSHWPVALWAAASVAVAIVAVAGYEMLAPPVARAPSGADVAVSADRTPPEQPYPSQRPAEDAMDRAADQAVIARVPAAEQPARRDSVPTVRVTIRRDDAPPPEEKTERAPAIPVERLSAATGDETQSLERTKPLHPAAPAQTQAAPAPTAAPPPPPPVATLSPPPAVPEAKPAPAKEAPPPAPAAKSSPAPEPKDVTAVGETVRLVQAALVERGYDPGPANGRAGQKTQAAIRKFQSDRGLQPNGAIDYDLLEKLGIVGPRVHAFRPPPGATVGR